jgi:hypothetical protein
MNSTSIKINEESSSSKVSSLDKAEKSITTINSNYHSSHGEFSDYLGRILKSENIVFTDEDSSDIKDNEQSIQEKYIITRYKSTYFIKGEEFRLERESDKIVLSHDKWSLTGEGSTLIEAELDVKNQIHEIAEEYIHAPITSLTNEAINLRDFILKVI